MLAEDYSIFYSLMRRYPDSMRRDWAYDGFDYAITMVDIIMDTFYNDPDYKKRYFGNLFDALEKERERRK